MRPPASVENDSAVRQLRGAIARQGYARPQRLQLPRTLTQTYNAGVAEGECGAQGCIAVLGSRRGSAVTLVYYPNVR